MFKYRNLNLKISSFLLFVLLFSTQALYACGCVISGQTVTGKCQTQGEICKCVLSSGEACTVSGGCTTAVEGGCESTS